MKVGRNIKGQSREKEEEKGKEGRGVEVKEGREG